MYVKDLINANGNYIDENDMYDMIVVRTNILPSCHSKALSIFISLSCSSFSLIEWSPERPPFQMKYVKLPVA